MHQSVKDCLDLEMAISSWPKGQCKPTNQRVMNYQNKMWFHITLAQGKILVQEIQRGKKEKPNAEMFLYSLP